MATVVRHDGQLKLMGNNNWHNMMDFVEMIHPRPAPANDNGK